MVVVRSISDQSHKKFMQGRTVALLMVFCLLTLIVITTNLTLENRISYLKDDNIVKTPMLPLRSQDKNDKQYVNEASITHDGVYKKEEDQAKPKKATEREVDVAVIGAAGNVGSKLMIDLHAQGYSVDGFDREVRLPDLNVTKRGSAEFSKEQLAKYSNIIFLGGCSGRAPCEKLKSADLQYEQVQSVLDLAAKLDATQHLVLVSTQSVAEGCGYRAHKEDDPINIVGLDSYSTSMRTRELAVQHLSNTQPARAPRITLLRMCTVVGVSQAQRIDLMIPAMMNAAYTTGVLKVTHGDSVRCFLWLPDLTRALGKVISPEYKSLVKPFSIYHLSSFTASVTKVAATIASMTGARIDAQDSQLPSSIGHSLDNSKFRDTFDFTFQGNLTGALQEMERHVPDSVTAKGPWKDPPIYVGHGREYDSVPCPVCGSHHLQEVLDLHEQPLANDFKESVHEALNACRYPLRLVRCKECNHMHLSHVVDRFDLFSNYIYRSGTSKTLDGYFLWFAKKVHKECGKPKMANVLEIACNDGSQLDHFKKLGWSTYGVDPASNLVPLAQKKGHVVKVGFWGNDLDFPSLPPPEKMDVIVAQNVLAHVPRPVDFLKSCAKVMSKRSRLYIQTSQCQMHQMGQFDTAYHEHISFFTGHSFYKAAILSGLYIENFETTPIHGNSCLVTFRLETDELPSSSLSRALMKRLDSEKADLIPTDFFYNKFRERSYSARTWLTSQLQQFSRKGFTIGAFGAAAKGMVLMQFMLGEHPDLGFEFEFVLDDEPMKQGKFCPGTSIPVWPTEKLRSLEGDKPLVILVLAWNFWEEISKNIIRELKGVRKRPVHILLPFPSPRLLELSLTSPLLGPEKTLLRHPYYPTPIPNPLGPNNPDRRKVMLITHFNNEELLLPYWIRNHAHMFDHAVMINYFSTDNSLDIITKMAPDSWVVVNSTNGAVLEAEDCDTQVVRQERKYPSNWHLALTSTEFLVHPQFRQTLMENQSDDLNGKCAYKIRSFRVIGSDDVPLKRMESLVSQRSMCMKHTQKYDRFVHINTLDSHHYSVGRHKFKPTDVIQMPPNNIGLIMKFQWSPWPQVIDRRMEVGRHVAESDKEKHRGWQHYELQREEDVVKARNQALSEDRHFDLCNSESILNYDPSVVDYHQFRTFHEATGKVCP